MRLPKNTYFMLLARLVSARSTCNSRHVGCVIVSDDDYHILATGYNGVPAGEPHCIDNGPEYCARRNAGCDDSHKQRICRAVHAEANAVCHAARHGVSLESGICYVTLRPCRTCELLLQSAGVIQVYYETDYDGVVLPEEDIHPDDQFLYKLTLRPEEVVKFGFAALTDDGKRRLTKTD